MTRAEWVEIVEWIADRFPRPWTGKQSEAFYWDLRGFSFGAVKEAVHTLYGKGLTRPPTGSEVLSLVAQISKDTDSEKIPMGDCRHKPIDDEGYCTACGGWPKLGVKYGDGDELKLAEISGQTRSQREILPTVANPPPEEQPAIF